MWRALRTVPGVVGIVALAGLTAAPVGALSGVWTSVGEGSAAGVSGIAPSDSGWVIVHDAKRSTQDRVALLDENAVVTPLTWPGTPPNDLEAIDRVPGSNEYVVVASSGLAWKVRLGSSAVTVDREFRLPGGLKQVESFALTSLDSSTVAVWAGRGSTSGPAKVLAAAFDPDAASFGPLSRVGRVRVPYPTADVRQVSDLKVVNGRILVSSTSDPGNRGPFTSAVYDVGTLEEVATDGRPTLSLASPVELGRYVGHKVEGIACSAGVGILGADDEKLGGAVVEATICPRTATG